MDRKRKYGSNKMTIVTIELDAGSWKTTSDFRSALKDTIGAPEWHGGSAAAFLDSIFGGGMNALEPPYLIRVVNTAQLAPELEELIRDIGRRQCRCALCLPQIAAGRILARWLSVPPI